MGALKEWTQEPRTKSKGGEPQRRAGQRSGSKPPRAPWELRAHRSEDHHSVHVHVGVEPRHGGHCQEDIGTRWRGIFVEVLTPSPC